MFQYHDKFVGVLLTNGGRGAGVSSTNHQGKIGEGSSLIVDATPHHLESGALKLDIKNM